jgi:hypothetical protein
MSMHRRMLDIRSAITSRNNDPYSRKVWKEEAKPRPLGGQLSKDIPRNLQTPPTSKALQRQMNTTLAINTELKPVAAAMRARQEQIEKDKRDVYGRIGSLVASAQEQGAAVALVKAKLSKNISLEDWLHAHVPNLTAQDAAKYERIAHEQLTDPRQCMFAFLPPSEAKDKETRTPPSPREVVWAGAVKLMKAFELADIKSWDETEKDLTRRELEPMAKTLWPDRFA